MITVKLIELGSEVKEYGMEDGSTVGDLLRIAHKSYVHGCVTRNNAEVSSGATLRNNDRIFVGKAMKGNTDPFEVTFVRLGDTSISLGCADGQSIKQVLEQLEDGEQRRKFFREDGTVAYEFRVGQMGQPVNENYVLNRPNSGSVRVICSQRVKGNFRHFRK